MNLGLHDTGLLTGFVACVVLATLVQNLTGFAFSLVLLGLVALWDLAPLIDAANAATVLTLVNAVSFFRLHRLQPQWRVITPAIAPSLMGVAVGVALLAWLSSNAVQWLRGLLGLAILVCAVLLMLKTTARSTLSSRATFAWVGALSGLMGGLFSSAGPPMVFHLYRQPLSRTLIRQCLVLIFAINQVLRLTLIVSTGRFTWGSVVLCACAVPVVHGTAWLQQRYMPPLSDTLTQRVVSALLLLAGASLTGSCLSWWWMQH